MEKIDKKDNQDNSILDGPKGKIQLYHKLVEYDYDNIPEGGWRKPCFVEMDLIFEMSKTKKINLGIGKSGCFRVDFDDKFDSKYSEEYPWDMRHLSKCYPGNDKKYLNLAGAKCIFVKDMEEKDKDFVGLDI